MTDTPRRPRVSAEVPLDQAEVARASCDRCCASADFIPTFYKMFFENCPGAQARFAGTDFRRQHQLLLHALRLLLLYPNRPEADGRDLLRRVAERHSRRDLDIPQEMYPPFVDSLMQAVAQFDPEFTPAIENSWRVTIKGGVEYMTSKY